MKKRYIVLGVLVTLILMQLIPIIYCEILTKRFESQFSGIQNVMIANEEYLKIISYKDDYAKVYYVGKDKSSGNIVEYTKNDADKWTEKSWKTIWSKEGSASDFMWPYWWDTIFH